MVGQGYARWSDLTLVGVPVTLAVPMRIQAPIVTMSGTIGTMGLPNVINADDISNASVYHAGTKWNADKNCYETNGGRVLAVVAQGDTLSEARQRAHNEIKKIQFHGMQRRPDIGFASFV